MKPGKILGIAALLMAFNSWSMAAAPEGTEVRPGERMSCTQIKVPQMGMEDTNCSVHDEGKPDVKRYIFASKRTKKITVHDHEKGRLKTTFKFDGTLPKSMQNALDKGGQILGPKEVTKTGE